MKKRILIFSIASILIMTLFPLMSPAKIAINAEDKIEMDLEPKGSLIPAKAFVFGRINEVYYSTFDGKEYLTIHCKKVLFIALTKIPSCNVYKILRDNKYLYINESKFIGNYQNNSYIRGRYNLMVSGPI